MSTVEEKAAILVEALPYIQHFHGKIVVVKYGGSAMINEELKQAVIKDIILMKLVGMRPVIVHGGGAEITSMLTSLNIETKFVDGLRVTDSRTMEIVEMVLVGKVNPEIVRNINRGCNLAVGLSGKDANMLLAEGIDSQKYLSFSGRIKKVNSALLLSLINDGYIPVIAPVGVDEGGQSYNVNADSAASQIAIALGAEKLVLLTDVDGLYAGQVGHSDVISYLNIADVPRLTAEGVISGGMIPKINCCVDAINGGVIATHIIDGRKAHSLLLEVFTKSGIGTMVGRVK